MNNMPSTSFAEAESSTLITARARSTEFLAQIGNTPLIELSRFLDMPAGVELYGKAEFLNPGGSVKDRAALAMILDGERTGKLTPGKIILDATSGNTGIAYAMVGAARGYRVALCLPANATIERKSILRAYGAEIIETSRLEGADGAQLHARALAAANPDKYFYPDQYNNPANTQAHYDGTGIEIWEQTAGRITHFVHGIGTAGTFTGTSLRLKEFNRSIRAVAMQPDSPLHGLEGMRHLETAMVPGNYDSQLADEFIEVSTEDAWRMTRRLAREAGIFVGVSSGANLTAAARLARELPRGSVIVTILCDTGTRYLSEPYWDVAD